jgi:hypothetical protein
LNYKNKPPAKGGLFFLFIPFRLICQSKSKRSPSPPQPVQAPWYSPHCIKDYPYLFLALEPPVRFLAALFFLAGRFLAAVFFFAAGRFLAVFFLAGALLVFFMITSLNYNYLVLPL